MLLPLIPPVAIIAELPAISPTLPNSFQHARGAFTPPYTLGPGDRIQIDLVDAPEYSGENGRYQVLVDGSLNLPLLGKVSVQGMSLEQVIADLSTRYARFYKRPVVTVKLLTPRPLTIGVAGEVVRPGVYSISLRSQNENNDEIQYPTLTTVLKLSGGIKQLADIHQIQLRRSDSGGREQVLLVSLWQLLQTGDLRHDPVLRDGDSIVVPQAIDLNPAETAQVATARFSPDTIQVNVVGEVRQPGVVRVPPNTPLNGGLLAAGGFDNKRANQRSVELIRLNPDGTVSRRRLGIDFTQGLNEQTNPPLHNNDVVIVNRSGTARLSDTLEGVFAPFGAFFSLSNFLRIFFP